MISTIHDNSDRIKETAKSGNEVFVQQDYRNPMGASRTKTMDVSHIFITLKISKYVK